MSSVFNKLPDDNSFHGDNTGSNPVGDANKYLGLKPIAPGTQMRRHDTYFLHLLRAQSWPNSELSRMHGGPNTCLSVYANQRIPAAPMTSNRALPWLPKKSSNPLDEAQKPYYCGTSHHHQRRLA